MYNHKEIDVLRGTASMHEKCSFLLIFVFLSLYQFLLFPPAPLFLSIMCRTFGLTKLGLILVRGFNNPETSEISGKPPLGSFYHDQACILMIA
jgi:hypothetical protein